MTRYFLRLPGCQSPDAALSHVPTVGRPVLERGPDGFVRGSVEMDASEVERLKSDAKEAA